jgi:hypothetical protein
MKRSSFTKPLILQENGKTFILKEPFEYRLGSLDNDIVITVPVGFETDFASIPSIFHPILPKLGLQNSSACLHDFLYQKVSEGKFNRAIADAIFLEGMQVLEVPWWKRTVMYLAVRIFGGLNIKLTKKQKID